MPVRIQTQDFDPGTELQQLAMQRPDNGALVSFIGLVRDINLNDAVSSLTLQHYPGMTEKIIAELISDAKQTWEIHDVLVIHRVGALQPQERIVLVAVSSAHRSAAFQACEFMIDKLKTAAPFWKKEGFHSQTGEQTRWLDSAKN